MNQANTECNCHIYGAISNMKAIKNIRLPDYDYSNDGYYFYYQDELWSALFNKPPRSGYERHSKPESIERRESGLLCGNARSCTCHFDSG